ncbi:MAG: hypothetical protein NTX98_01120, partial [Candidatus Doudnabacteria bacterium]|nr:hypothetical protein [Candidatus Doudnabacteria bacterium]
AAGLIGWQYAVNLTAPNIGAADFQLKDSDEVLWYFGNFDDKLTRLTLSSAEIAANSTATVTVEYQDSQIWKPLEGALVYFGTNTQTTGNDGNAEVKPQDGYYKIYAEKTGFIRTNSSTLKIGSPTSASISLSAAIGQIKGEEDNQKDPNAISFTASPSSLDFGQLTAGQQSAKNLQIKNTGSVKISLTASVEGDSIFKENLAIGNRQWKNFSSALDVSEEKSVSAKLSVPAGYEQSGIKQGQLILWARTE